MPRRRIHYPKRVGQLPRSQFYPTDAFTPAFIGWYEVAIVGEVASWLCDSYSGQITTWAFRYWDGSKWMYADTSGVMHETDVSDCVFRGLRVPASREDAIRVLH